MLTEATYLLDFSNHARRALLEFIARGAVEVVDFDAAAVGRASAMMKKYRDLQMDFADVTLVVLAESLATTTVFTLDRRDFGIYRVGGVS